MKSKILFVLLSFVLMYGCSSTRNTIEMKSRADWQALDPKPFKSHVPVRITIHHEGEYLDPNADAGEKIKKTQVWGMGKDRNWADIPYHFMIDAKGTIWEGRNVFTAGETNTTYDPTGHLLITCLGNFEEQEMTESQLKSLIDLVAYCCVKYNISPDTIKGHKDYAETLCPGKNLYKYLQDGSLIARVKETMKAYEKSGVK